MTRDDFEILFEQSAQEHSSAYGGDDPNLADFRDRSGKLLIVHGWADQLVPAQKTIAYYKAVQQRMGGAEETSAFVRLFLVPGGDHGLASPVPTPSAGAMVGALMRWVGQGRAPERFDAQLIDDHDKLVRSRRLYPYVGMLKY